jgi:hypothetical protein
MAAAGHLATPRGRTLRGRGIAAARGSDSRYSPSVVDLDALVNAASSLGGVFGVVAAVGSGGYAAIKAGVSWREKARESRLAAAHRRMTELRGLTAHRDECKPIFDEIFDYESDLDDHLRITDLRFKAAEALTRSKADQAFEHLREVHRVVELGLIEKADLGPWVYWVHRVGARRPLKLYAEACGYWWFVAELAAWTADSQELKLLREKCPWWQPGEEGGRAATEAALFRTPPSDASVVEERLDDPLLESKGTGTG